MAGLKWMSRFSNRRFIAPSATNKQGQMPLHAIVGLRRGHLDELLRDVNHADIKVLAFLQVSHQVAAPRDNHAVARLEPEFPPVALKCAIPGIAIGMADIAGKFRHADPGQRVIDDNVLYSFHIPQYLNELTSWTT